MPCGSYRMGLDIGSTTTKAAIFQTSGNLIFKDYKRHHGRINESVKEILEHIKGQYGDFPVSLAITGSAGMGLSEKFGIPFIQELIACSDYVSDFYPEVKTLLDIGGEDSKVILFNNNGNDFRMNSSCAGGTGSFIDQMSTLLNISLENLNELAYSSKRIYPIASRCGVFAKTDIQNLLSNEISKPDISASIFYAMALQIKNTLMRGYNAIPQIIFTGGPLSFFTSLRKSIIKLFKLKESDIIDFDDPLLIPAFGAALSNTLKNRLNITIDSLSKLISSPFEKINIIENKLEPLFSSNNEYNNWISKQQSIKTNKIKIECLNDKNCFLGIDSGSTTTKIVLIDEDDNIAFEYYNNNNGNPLNVVSEGLRLLYEKSINITLNIRKTAVTGYGEELIRSAFNIDYGIIETIAHYTSSSIFVKDVSFILDIGGQDIKAIFVKDGIIENIEINEACSSGCGSFIETFANSLNFEVKDFALEACKSHNPCDLGTRCTVFMNSKVKQAFREGTSIDNISAGLSYSVVNNCLNKVLRIHDIESLGDKIIVQGGTFRNPAVHRAFEKIIGKEVIKPDIPELMGAFGAALIARNRWNVNKIEPSNFKLNPNDSVLDYFSKQIYCKGCENSCQINKLTFANGNTYFTGNRCENIFNNSTKQDFKGFNLPAYKFDLLFNRDLSPADSKVKIGIPRVLNIFENFPFWSKLFTECGFEIVLSDKSTNELCDSGSGTVLSDNICYPAKLVHGHIVNLINKGVDRIFYPMVQYEVNEFSDFMNCYNCPVVSGYPNVIKSAINPENNYSIPFDSPNITFKENNFLRRACYLYFKKLGISRSEFKKAFNLALLEQRNYKNAIKKKSQEIINSAIENNRSLVVLACRPYHIDNLINHNIPNIISSFGIDVITDDSLPYNKLDDIRDSIALTQWAYPNRLYKAAKWVGRHNKAELIQLNSFGCGPDAITIEETKEIIEQYGKFLHIIRIDEHSSPGSLKLRLSSLVESLKYKHKNQDTIITFKKRANIKPFSKIDKNKTILLPFFSPFHSSYISTPFTSLGYKVELLPPSGSDSIDLGLKYVNNEICYPATLVIGDILSAIKSGKYDTEKIAVGITQTGGQCRASNYVPLLKKALIRSGYNDIPVVSISISKKKLNYQPGFKFSRNKLILKGILGLFYGDAISEMYYAMKVREKYIGTTDTIAAKYNELASIGVQNNDLNYLLLKLKEAVQEFNDIEITDNQPLKVGVVGEIYIKYNPYCNRNVINKLIEQGVHIQLPPLVNMFSQWLINVRVKHDLNIENKFFSVRGANILEKYYNYIFRKFDSVTKDFKFYSPKHTIRDLSKKAEKVMSLSNHYYGEGWLIAADIIAFAEQGIKKVLCLQPFGCIANHIVARGAEKSLKDLIPNLNIQFLDIDSSTSDVNLHNRLLLLMNG